MIRAAIVKEGTVTNVVVVDPATALAYAAAVEDAGLGDVVESETAGIGWTYIDGEFNPPA